MISATHPEATLIIVTVCEHPLRLTLCVCDLSYSLEQLCEVGCGIMEHGNHR